MLLAHTKSILISSLKEQPTNLVTRGAVYDDGSYEVAVARCKASARKHGHALGEWLPVDKHLHASICEVCGAIGYVTRPGYEKRWRVGGQALAQACLGESEANLRRRVSEKGQYRKPGFREHNPSRILGE